MSCVSDIHMGLVVLIDICTVLKGYSGAVRLCRSFGSYKRTLDLGRIAGLKSFIQLTKPLSRGDPEQLACLHLDTAPRGI